MYCTMMNKPGELCSFKCNGKCFANKRKCEYASEQPPKQPNPPAKPEEPAKPKEPTVQYVLAEIIDGKIHGLYGGYNEKYSDVINYVCSTDFHKRGKKYKNLEEANKIKSGLNKAGYSFEIIVV